MDPESPRKPQKTRSFRGSEGYKKHDLMEQLSLDPTPIVMEKKLPKSEMKRRLRELEEKFMHLQVALLAEQKKNKDLEDQLISKDFKFLRLRDLKVQGKELSIEDFDINTEYTLESFALPPPTKQKHEASNEEEELYDLDESESEENMLYLEDAVCDSKEDKGGSNFLTRTMRRLADPSPLSLSSSSAGNLTLQLARKPMVASPNLVIQVIQGFGLIESGKQFDQAKLNFGKL
jgi:hypothetical protein